MCCLVIGFDLIQPLQIRSNLLYHFLTYWIADLKDSLFLIKLSDLIISYTLTEPISLVFTTIVHIVV